ncbi:MAG: CDP-alcohol phosphatidyltransferase family protein [Elusimicrobiota bacterium]|jgi:phosphatidylglycerophosphate synthase
MITDALLWVNRPEILLQRVGGLTVLERHLHTLSRAGLRRVWVPLGPASVPPARVRLPPGLDIIWSQPRTDTRGALPPEACQPPYLVLSGNHFIRVDTLAHIARNPSGQHSAFVDSARTSVVQIVPTRDEALSPAHEQPLPEGSAIPLQQPLSDESTLDWLMAVGIKSYDGFMAKHFDRHISLAISRRLMDTPVSPNMMTVFSCLVGLAGTFCFLSHSRGAHLLGALLVWAHAVLDGCDGELARVRFQESRLGGEIDFWGDNLVHLSLFGCLGAGFARADASLLPLVASAMATVGIIGSAVLVDRRRSVRRQIRPSGAPRPAGQPGLGALLARLEIILEQRDFIYLLLLLAYIGHTYEFLWAGAVGALLFFMMLIQLGRADREQTLQPHNAD